jgi:phage terminase small subunit
VPLPTTADPKVFLLAMMNNGEADVKLRVDAAKALLPFMHRRAGEDGKKGEAKEAAKRASKGRFAPRPPPLKLIR